MSDANAPLFESGAASPAELLERVHRRLAAEGQPPAPPSGPRDPVFDLSTGMGLGDGWWAAEEIGGRPMRWTQRRFAFEAFVEDATHVELEAALAPESGFLELRARLRADARSGTAFRLRPGWNALLVPIPAGSRGRVRFEIDAGGSWCPADSGATDVRELALLVRRLALVRFLEPPEALAGRPGLANGSSLASRIARRLFRWLTVERRVTRLENRLAAIVVSQAELAADLDDREVTIREDVARKLSAPLRPD